MRGGREVVKTNFSIRAIHYPQPNLFTFAAGLAQVFLPEEVKILPAFLKNTRRDGKLRFERLQFRMHGT
jgi:hypothetical protein